MSWLALSASYEYLCYGSTSLWSMTIIIILILPVRGASLYVRSRRQILTYKDGPRDERVKTEHKVQDDVLLVKAVKKIGHVTFQMW